MYSGNEKIVVKVEGLRVKTELEEPDECNVKTEEFRVKNEVFDVITESQDYALVHDKCKVKSEYNKYYGQCWVPEDCNIKLESNILDNAHQVQNKAAVSSTVTDHVTRVGTLNYENITFGCAICFEEFTHEQEYDKHMSIHLQTGDANSERVTSQVCESRTTVNSGWDSAHNIEHKHAVQSLDDDSHPSTATDLAQPSITPWPPRLSTEDDAIKKNKQTLYFRNEFHKQMFDSYDKTVTDFNNFKTRLKLYDMFKTSQSQKCVSSNDKLNNTASTVSHCQGTIGNDVTMSRNLNIYQSINYCFNNDSNTQFTNSAVSSLYANNEKKCFICDVCRKTFNKRRFLVKHLRSHSDKKEFSCKFCKYKSNYKGNLVNHMRTHSTDKPYSCTLCNYSCAANCNLLYHMQTHSGEKPYSCTACNYKCVAKGSLVRHMRTHTGERPYSCKFCDFKFAQKSHLVVHIRSHTGERPYCCNLCVFKCAQKSDLVKHMRIHTGEKPYSCKLCKYKSASNSHLVKHMRTHTDTDETSYSCTDCEYKGTSKRSLCRHRVVHTRKAKAL